MALSSIFLPPPQAGGRKEAIQDSKVMLDALLGIGDRTGGVAETVMETQHTP